MTAQLFARNEERGAYSVSTKTGRSKVPRGIAMANEGMRHRERRQEEASAASFSGKLTNGLGTTEKVPVVALRLMQSRRTLFLVA